MICMTDGTFEGVLTSVFETWHVPAETIRIAVEGTCQLQLGDEVQVVSTNNIKAERVRQGILRMMKADALDALYHAHLSEKEAAGTAILRTIRKGMQEGPRIMGFLQDPDVFCVEDLRRKVMKESHLYLGILRFVRHEPGVYVASFEPQYNVLEPVASHFSERLADQAWMIHDRKRNRLAWFNGREVFLTGNGEDKMVKQLETAIAMEKEKPGITRDAGFESLWREYFRTIAIQSRKNLKLQQHFIPKRYWKHLLEKQPDLTIDEGSQSSRNSR